MEAPAPSWTEERVAQLRSLVDEGYSAGDIAVRMGGLTKNGVIGKCHRLGIVLALAPNGRMKPQRPGAPPRSAADAQPKQRPPAIARPKPPPAPKRQAVKPAPKPVLIVEVPKVDPTPKLWPKPACEEARELVDLDLYRSCRMPLWGNDVKIGLYCGKPVSRPGSSWCSACVQLVYTAGREPNSGKPIPKHSRRTGAFA